SVDRAPFPHCCPQQTSSNDKLHSVAATGARNVFCTRELRERKLNGGLSVKKRDTRRKTATRRFSRTLAGNDFSYRRMSAFGAKQGHFPVMFASFLTRLRIKASAYIRREAVFLFSSEQMLG